LEKAAEGKRLQLQITLTARFIHLFLRLISLYIKHPSTTIVPPITGHFHKSRKPAETASLMTKIKKTTTRLLTLYCAVNGKPFETPKDKYLPDLMDNFAKMTRQDPSIKAEDILPCPTTISRNVTWLAAEIKASFVLMLGFWITSLIGVAFSTDMYTQPHTYAQTSYIYITHHFPARTHFAVSQSQ
jgi:hypothetical protein